VGGATGGGVIACCIMRGSMVIIEGSRGSWESPIISAMGVESIVSLCSLTFFFTISGTKEVDGLSLFFNDIIPSSPSERFNVLTSDIYIKVHFLDTMISHSLP